MRCLVVDDDRSFALRIAEALGRRYGAEGVVCVSGARQAMEHIRTQSFDVILLDWFLPDADRGELVLDEARRYLPGAAIIMLSEQARPLDEAEFLERGVAEFVCKPIAEQVLLARIEKAVERVTQPAAISAGGIALDLERAVLRWRDCEARLTPNEVRAMAALVRAQGEVVSEAHLTAAVWDDPAVPQTTALLMLVSRLRDKLKAEFGDCPIETVKGKGYRLSI